LIEKRLASAVHAAEVAVIAGLDRLKTPKQQFLFYSLLFCSRLFCPFLLCSFSVYSLSPYSLSLCSLYNKALRINY
jgi:hypothetical protein